MVAGLERGHALSAPSTTPAPSDVGIRPLTTP